MNRTNDEEVTTVLTSATENATNINPNEASYDDQPAKYSDYGTPTYEKFTRYNRGWNGPKRENKEVNRNQDNLAIFDALSGRVGLTDYQKSKGRRTLTQLDLPKIGKSVDVVAFAICILVANDDVHNGHRYWPNGDKDNHPEAFTSWKSVSDPDNPFEIVADSLSHDEAAILSVLRTVDSRRDEAA